MKKKKIKCKTCGAPLELFVQTIDIRPITEDGGIEEAMEPNVPGSNVEFTLQCSEEPDHEIGDFVIDIRRMRVNSK